LIIAQDTVAFEVYGCWTVVGLLVYFLYGYHQPARDRDGSIEGILPKTTVTGEIKTQQ
jgi:hypothetical protein